MHAKSPRVVVAGLEQRFCQQCSRFHLLVEFDEVKRSCRKRLDGHNRRRRKQQPDPLGPAGLFANHHGGGTRFVSYPQIFSTTTSMAPEHKWPGSIAVKTEADAFQVEQYYSSLQLNGAANAAASLFHGKERSKRFPFLSDHHGDTGFQQQPFTITPSSESSSNSSSRHSNGNKMFATNDGGPDHNCALSLLSDSPTTQAAHTMITAAAQHLGGARIHYNVGGDGGGGVSLTGLSYASAIMGDNKGSAQAAMASSTRHAGAVTTAPSVAAQLQQYHGYYQHQVNGDQGNSADAGASMQALPFSSW